MRTEKVVGVLMALKASELTPGQTFTAVVVEDLKRTQLVQYAGASGDYNPLHTDEVFATKVAGYPSVFAHGMLTMGMTGRMVTDLVGDGRLTSFGGRFTSQVFPGDDLTTTATVDEVHDDDGEQVVELSLRTANQDDKDVFSGYATARSIRDPTRVRVRSRPGAAPGRRGVQFVVRRRHRAEPRATASAAKPVDDRCAHRVTSAAGRPHAGDDVDARAHVSGGDVLVTVSGAGGRRAR